LRKYDGEVGVSAKALVTKWKNMVASEHSEGEQEEKDDDVHDKQDDQHNSPEMNEHENGTRNKRKHDS
jgi:transcription elongation factor B polypeptide 3